MCARVYMHVSVAVCVCVRACAVCVQANFEKGVLSDVINNPQDHIKPQLASPCSLLPGLLSQSQYVGMTAFLHS